jgi:RhtB (resistance to homoserine/threonine) family protein
MLWAFVPIAVLVTITPGPGTAMVVRSAIRDGWRAGVLTIAGNAAGVLTWGLLSVVGISALVAASEVAFATLKVVGAVVLVVLGIQSIRRSRAGAASDPAPEGDASSRRRRALRDGLITSLANPKLAVFFVALFPQFVDDRASVLPSTMLMTLMIVTFDFLWYGGLAVLASRAKRELARTRLARWLERTTGAVLIALGARVALEQR